MTSLPRPGPSVLMGCYSGDFFQGLWLIGLLRRPSPFEGFTARTFPHRLLAWSCPRNPPDLIVAAATRERGHGSSDGGGTPSFPRFHPVMVLPRKPYHRRWKQ